MKSEADGTAGQPGEIGSLLPNDPVEGAVSRHRQAVLPGKRGNGDALRVKDLGLQLPPWRLQVDEEMTSLVTQRPGGDCSPRFRGVQRGEAIPAQDGQTGAAAGIHVASQPGRLPGPGSEVEVEPVSDHQAAAPG